MSGVVGFINPGRIYVRYIRAWHKNVSQLNLSFIDLQSDTATCQPYFIAKMVYLTFSFNIYNVQAHNTNTIY